jgi:3-oxoadipate enol-lactonase
MPDGPEVETTSREGRTIAWRRVGTGPPLLLVNGYAATGLDWDPTFIAALGDDFQLICPDNRGFGASGLGDPGRDPYTIDSLAADMEAVLDAGEIDRIPVAGWSMGGFVAQRLALRGRRVEAMALIATDQGGPEAVPADPALWARLTDDSGTPREQATRVISVLFPPGQAEEVDRRFGEQVAAAREAIDPAAARAQEEAMDAWHEERQPSPGPAAPPVLAVCGGDDAVIPAANTTALTTIWPDARAERLAGCTHGLMAQEPRRLARLISKFLSGRE